MFVPFVSLFKFQSYGYGAKKSSDASPASSTVTVQHFLATIDVTRGEDLDVESTLKFFKWFNTSRESKFRLVSQVSRPHGRVRVNSLAFMHCTASLASGASDGSVKIWSGDSADIWTCKLSFQYRYVV